MNDQNGRSRWTDAASFGQASPDQHDGIERLLRAAFTPYVRKLGRDLTPDAYAWLDRSIQSGEVFIAIHDDDIVGVVAMSRQADQLVIDQIAVHPERQGLGIGSWLLDNMATVARSVGAKALTLNTAEVMEDLLRLYRRHGFAEARRAPAAHGKDAHLRIFMRKAL